MSVREGMGIVGEISVRYKLCLIGLKESERQKDGVRKRGEEVKRHNASDIMCFLNFYIKGLVVLLFNSNIVSSQTKEHLKEQL